MSPICFICCARSKVPGWSALLSRSFNLVLNRVIDARTIPLLFLQLERERAVVSSAIACLVDLKIQCNMAKKWRPHNHVVTMNESSENETAKKDRRFETDPARRTNMFVLILGCQWIAKLVNLAIINNYTHAQT